MKKLIYIFIFVSILSPAVFAQGIDENTWQDGDIIFIKHPSMPVTPVKGDKKNFNCAGIILHDGGHAYVYFVDDKLKKMQLDEFIALSEGKSYSVKWLMEKEIVTPEAIATMRTFCNAKMGTPKDVAENLNSDELYNAEFVWKIYTTTLGVKLCEPKELTASGDPKKDVSNTSGYANKSVSVRDIYRSDIIE
jgi:hypothetical protein